MIRLIAPAKVNLTLEVLRKRHDGYHEVATVMQAIDLFDRITLAEAHEIELTVSGPEAGGVPEDPEQNLAYRAAAALQQATAGSRGVRIEIEKHVPAAAGLGGGSSDAAAVLRGLDRLWGLNGGRHQLEDTAAGLGSDVPFFLHCGSAFATGRGEKLELMPDIRPPGREIVLFTTDMTIEDKTRRMYGALQASDFSDGALTAALCRDARKGEIGGGSFFNAFDRAAAAVFPGVGAALRLCREAGLHAVLAGAGPSFFVPVRLAEVPASLLETLGREYGIRAAACRFLGRDSALAVVEG